MKRLSTLFIAVVAFVTIVTYGFNFPFNENTSGLKTIMSQTPLTPLNVQSPNAVVTESFDGLVLPAGWTNSAYSGTYTWTFPSSGTSPTCTPHSGAGMASFQCFSYSAGNQALLMTPAFSLTSGTGTVSFWMYRDPGYATTYDSIGIYVNTSASLTGAYFLGNIWRYTATAGWYQFTYNIPASFNTATNYIIFKAYSAYGNNMYLDDVSYGVPSLPGPMGYASSTTTKLNPGMPYTPGTTNNQIVKVAVSDTGSLSPFLINRLRFSTTGSNNPATDITNAKLWYTRSVGTFATTRQYGTSIANPNGVMNFSDTATLDPNATNNFWLTYDISPSAVIMDSLNASCDSIIGSSPMGGVVPSVTYQVGGNAIDNYCIGTYTNAGLPYGIYISNVNFGSINNTSMCPSLTPYVWSRYTDQSTVVRQNNPYPITVTNQNIGNPNSTAFGIYIDWNNNNSFLDPGEYIPTTVIPANTTTTATATINVPSNATIGSHRMRIRANLSTAPGAANVCAVLTYGEQEDYTVIVGADTSMTYATSIATQTVLSSVYLPAVNQQILGLQVVTAGNTNPISATSFSFGTNGSTNPATDITNAKLYFTGTNPNFLTTTQVGAPVNNPNGPFTIAGSSQLSSGINYFWLTYDVPSGAVVGDSLDAQCNSITVGGNTYIPAVIAPAGKRGISGNAICGTQSIPGTFPSIAAAITALNAQGTLTCPVVFNVAAGYTEVAANLTITVTGTAANTVIFQKSGAGANPRVVAGVGTGTYDGIIKLYGASYFTFDGIDLSDTVSNATTTTQMEWGYALLRPNGTTGNQNNTIKNCNVTLNKVNTATYGIYSSNINTAGTVQTISATSGTNSYNKFLSNNISNCYGGIYLYSPSDATFPFSLEDQSNVISNTGGSGRNSITNFGGSTTTAYGIYAYYQCNPTITNTYINSRGGVNSTGYLYGIYNYAYNNSGNITVSGDTVTLADTTGSIGYQYGIYNYTYYCNDNIVTNNVVKDCANLATGAYYSYYFYNYTASGSQLYVKNNIFTGNKVINNTYGVAASSTGYKYDIYNYLYASNRNYVYNNLDSANTVLGTTSYAFYQFYNAGLADTAICNQNRVVNNTICGTTATATIYGLYASSYQSYLFSQVDSNTVSNNTSPSTGAAAYYCLYNNASSANIDFRNNTVSGNNMSGTGTMYGMYFSPTASPPIGSTENIIYNNVTNLQKLTATGTGTIYGLYHGGSSAGTVNINNNTITGFTSAAATGYYGIYQIGSPSNWVNIINNKIGNFNTAGAGTIYGLYNNPSATTQANISQDSVYNLTSAGGTIYGLYSYNGNPVNIYKNKISGLSSTTAATGVVYGLYLGGGTINNVYNNFISDLTAPASTVITPAISGIYVSAGTYDNIYNNTVYLKAVSSSVTTFGTAALYVATTYNVDLRNNILVDNSTPGATGGQAVAYRRSSTTLTTYLTGNNNLFYAGTPSTKNLIYYDGTNSDQTLAAYKTRVIPRDNNSVTELPPFVNGTTAPYDLHINTGTATQLESGGQTIATPVNIVDDGFGTARFPNSGYPVGAFTPTAPDIGAHEFGGTRTNGVGPVITYTALGIGGTSNRSFNNVLITAPAGVNTTAGTKPRVYYKRSIDGNVINDNTSGTDGWKYAESNGTTSPFDFTIDYSKLNGGTGVIAGQIVNYFVVAQDLNGTPNVSANQATFTTAPTTVALVAGNAPVTNNLSYTIGTATFSGVIPVGTGQTYTSLTSAGGIFAALNAGTVSGDITISVTSDLVEDGTNQLNALNESGVGSYKTKIVPASASLKTISGWVSQAMIRLNGVRRVTIDGNNGLGAKYLTFRNKLSGTANPVVQFMNETGVDTLKNCTIEGANYGTASGLVYFSTTTLLTGFGNDSICVNGCDIRDRSDSTAVYANGIYSLGTSTTLLTYNNNNSIINNNIYNYYYDGGAFIAGIYLSSYNTNWKISGNSFYQTVSRAPALASSICDIYSTSTLNNDIQITSNYFGGTAPSCGGTALTYTGAGAYSLYPIYISVGLLAPSSIQGNTFQNVNLTISTASVSSFYRPVYVTSGYVNVGNLSGNTIGSGTGTGNISLTTNTTASSYTLAMIYHLGIGAVMNNTIGSISIGGNSTGIGDLYAGIYWSNSTVGQIYTLSNNLIGSLTTANSIQVNNQSNYHSLRGIFYLNGTGTVNYITNNIVANLTSFSTIGTSGTNLISNYGIQHNSATMAPMTLTGNTVKYLTVNQNIAYSSYALLGIGASGVDFNTVTNNSVYGLYSNGTGGGTPLIGAMLLGGYTGGLCSQNKIFDFRYSGTGVSNPYPLILGLNCQSYGVWNIVNNMVEFTNGEPTDMSIKTKDKETFAQVIVENPPINKMVIPTDNIGKIPVTPVVEGPRNPGLYDESNGPVKDKPVFKGNNSVKDGPNSINQVSVAGAYHTNNTWKGAVNYYNNSFYVGGSVPAISTFNSYAFVRTANGLVNLKNNIFENARTGGGGFHYAIANEGSLIEGWPANSSNYNLFVAASNTIGEWGIGNFLTYPLWSFYTSGDANSVWTTPTYLPGTTLFRNITTDDLNIDTTKFGAAYVYHKGIGNPGVTTDYNGYPRNTSGPVNIGAHEFELTQPVGITLLLPVNGNTGTQTPVAMRWSKGLFATSYGIQIATDSLFVNTVVTTTSPDTTYSFTGASILSTYYWRVNPIYTTGATGPVSSIFNFKAIGTPNVPVLNAPANNATNQAINLTFNWFKSSDQTSQNAKINKSANETPKTGVKSIANYWFDLSTDSTFTAGVTTDSTLTDSTKSVVGLLNATKYFWRVKSKNQFGWSGYSAVWSLTTIVPMPLAPVLSAPPNGATNVNPAPTLSWGAVSYAASYRIQIADSTKDTVNFTTSTWDTTGVTIAQLTCPTGKLAYAKKYWWRVSATNLAGTGPYSTMFNFRTSSDPTALSMSNFVSLLCPKYMASGTSTRLPVAIRGTIQGLVPNKTYRYYNMFAIRTDIGTTAAGAGILMLINTTTNAFTYSSLGGLITAGQYETFVANASGNYTGWFGGLNSGNARFTAGNYVYPTIVLGDSVGTLLSRYAMNDSIQVLAFNAAAGATNGTGVYGLSLGIPKNFVATYDNIAGTGKPLSTSWIEKQGTTIASVAPFYLDSVNQFDGRWGNILPNTLPNGLQRVEQWGMNGTLLSFNTSATGVWPSGTNTVNPAGGTAALRLALYDAPLLNPPVLVSPVSGTANTGTTPTLTWNISNVATSYRLQINTDSTFTAASAFDTAGLAGLTITVPSGKLTTNSRYYWRLSATNALGTSLWQSPWNFSTAPNAPNSPVLLLPTNGAINQPTTVLCVWRKSVETLASSKGNNGKGNTGKDELLTMSNYWHEYSTDSTFATGVIRDTTLADTAKSITGLTNSTSYFWRVKGKNQTGWGSFSSPFKFTVVPAIPGTPTLATPLNNATGVSLTPALTWNIVSGASTYRIQVSTDSNFVTTQWDTTGVAGLTTTVPAGKLSQTTKYYWRVNATNAGGTGAWSVKWNFTTLSLYLTLNLKVYLEGFWNGTTQVSDTVMVYLANSTTFALVDTAKVVLSATGTASMNFNRATAGSYYVVVNHRNHLETWSKLPQSFVGGTPLSYDFTTAMTQAFGDNMKQVGTVWVLFGGDANRDGSIDGLDVTLLVPQFGTQGYLEADFDGDQDVTGLDVALFVPNFGMTKVVPTLVVIPVIKTKDFDYSRIDVRKVNKSDGDKVNKSSDKVNTNNEKVNKSSDKVKK